MSVFWQLRWFFRLEWRRYAIAVLALIGVAGAVMVPPWITGLLVDSIAEQTLTRQDLLRWVGIILIVSFISYALRVVWRVALFGASYQLANRLRQDIYRHLTRQSGGFYQKHRTGDLMARATNDVQAVEMTAGEAVLAMFDGALTGLVVLVILTTQISWQLTLLALLPWPIVGYFMWRFGRELHASFRTAQARFSDLNDRVQESVSGIRLIRAYGRAHIEDEQFNQIARAANVANTQVARTDAKYDPAISMAVGMSFFLSVAGGAWLIVHDQLTLGQLTSFTLYLGFMIWPMFAIGWLLNLVERGHAAYERINELLQAEPEIADHGRIEDTLLPSLAFNIESFCYPGDDTAYLRNIQLSVPAGSMLGIVGHTGAGKTTLLKLLLRLEESPTATVQLGGVNVRELSLQNLRDHIAVVPQTPFLFTASIADNIALGRPEASMEDIERVARIAQVHDDITAFPDGYHTLVGERGVTLSGGQKQRVAIARALLVDAPILVLDDALSAVDVQTERQILQHLQAARGQKTTLIACHRLTAIEQAQHIVVLHHGVITEQGTHLALLQQGEWYRRMYDYQQLELAVEEGR